MTTFNSFDLDQVLTQMVEARQPRANAHLPFGLRQVDRQNKHAVPGQRKLEHS